MKRLLASSILAAIGSLILTGGVLAEGSKDFCGPDEIGYFRCGAILVILVDGTPDTIGDVIERMGGNGSSDVRSEFTGVRDLFNPAGVVDVTAVPVYQVAVPVGQEHEMAAAYRADPAVYGANVDRETIGTLTPDTALRASMEASWLIWLGLGFLMLVSIIGVRTAVARRFPDLTNSE